MTKIFRSLIGMTLMVGLFLTFEALIENHVPELELIASSARGFVYIILLMGVIVISKSTIELLRSDKVYK